MPQVHRVGVKNETAVAKDRVSSSHYSGENDPVPEIFSRLGFEWLYRLIRQ